MDAARIYRWVTNWKYLIRSRHGRSHPVIHWIRVKVIWGVAHLFPTKSVVQGFGDLLREESTQAEDQEQRQDNFFHFFSLLRYFLISNPVLGMESRLFGIGFSVALYKRRYILFFTYGIPYFRQDRA